MWNGTGWRGSATVPCFGALDFRFGTNCVLSVNCGGVWYDLPAAPPFRCDAYIGARFVLDTAGYDGCAQGCDPISYLLVSQ